MYTVSYLLVNKGADIGMLSLCDDKNKFKCFYCISGDSYNILEEFFNYIETLNKKIKFIYVEDLDIFGVFLINFILKKK